MNRISICLAILACCAVLLPQSLRAQCVEDHSVAFVGGGPDTMVICEFLDKKVGVEIGAPGLYQFVLTDENGVIVDHQGASWIVLSEIETQPLRIYGVSWWGFWNEEIIGQNINDAEFASICYTLSQNYIVVIPKVVPGFSLEVDTICADVVDIQITAKEPEGDDTNIYAYRVTSDKGLDIVLEGKHPSFQLNGSQEITITQTIIVDEECTTTNSQTIDLDLEDTGIDANDTLTICAGSSVFLNPGFNPLYTYTWDPTTYLTYPNDPNPLAEPTESITYTATVFDPVRNCTIEESIHVIVVPNSSVKADFRVEKDCGSLTIRFINTSMGGDSFVWTFGDPDNPDFISAERDPTYTYPSGGTYDVVLTIPGDECNAIRSKRLAVTGEDFVDDFVTELESCGPSLVDLNTGLNPLYIYRWEDHPKISDPTVAIPEVFLDADASFRVTVTDPLNETCVIDGTVNVTIGDQLVVEIEDTIYICEPGSVELNPDGDESLIYDWTPAELLDDPTSANPTATVDEEVRFVVKVTDPTDASCMVRLPVHVLFGLDDGGFEDGDTLIICDSSSFFINPGANPDLVYVWSPAEGLDDPILPNPIASPTESITYTVTVSDSSGMCSIMKSIHVEIVPSDVTVDFSISKECNSLTLQFINESVGASTFAWTFGDPAFPDSVSTEVSPTFTYSKAGTFEVELRSGDDPNCTAIRARRVTITGDDFDDFSDTIRTCDPRRVPLNPDRNPNYIYAWQADPAIADTTEANPIVSLSEDRTFFVTVTDPLNDTCTISGEVIVIADDRLVDSLPDSLIRCMPGAYELNPAGKSEFSYRWEPADLLDDPTSPNPTATVDATTVFTVTIEDPSDATCAVDTEVKVVIAMEDEVDLITSDPVDMACLGDTVTVTAKADLVDSLTWCDPSGDVIGTGPELTFPLIEGGTYTVKGEVDGCTFVDSVFLGLRRISFTVNPDRPVCAGDPAEITVTNDSDFLIDSVIWMPEDDIALGQGSETVVVRPDVTTVYTAMVIFEDGCVVTDSVTVAVSDIDDRFMATADPDTIFFGETTTLTATPEEGAMYEWTPTDDLQTPNQNSTVAVPPETTTYNVKITDANGCMTQQSVQVVVIVVMCEPPYIFLPNAFSPNADQVNDVLFLEGQYIDNMDLFIYDRWGQLVFESHNPEDGWDGTFRGKELSPDVFGYHLRVQCIGGDQHIEKGNITLLK